MIEFPEPVHERELIGVPPRCLGCAYILENLEAPRCPECGRLFDPKNPKTYTRKPGFVLWKYWLPGFLLATIGGGAMMLAFLAYDQVGWGLALATPFAIGALLGYGVRAPTALITILSLFALVAIITMLRVTNATGAFCGFILGCASTVPILFGCFFGWSLRIHLKLSKFSQKWYLPVVAILLLPALTHGVEMIVRTPLETETVTTSHVVALPLEEAWSRKIFKDGTTPPPPALMNFGLPHPQETRGSSQVGRLKRARMSKGELEVRITQRVELRLLAYEFVGQNHVEDRAIKLLDGRFEVEAIDPTHTRVTISSHYQPLMTPRWYWRPFELMSGKSVHGYIVEEMLTDRERVPARPGK
jgi:hypothetical protein